MVILVGNTGGETVHPPINIVDSSLLAERSTLRIYNSERRGWEKRSVGDTEEFAELPLNRERWL
jgi:hypothetical protein